MKPSGFSVFTFILLSLPFIAGGARAENIFDILFGGFANRNAAAQNPGSGHSGAPHKHFGSVRVKSAPPVEDATAKYLRSPEFSRRFAAGETDDAIAYMLRNDATLQSGDAVMTKDGLRIFDPKGGEGKFLPLKQVELDRARSTRLAELERAKSPAESGVVRLSLNESRPLGLLAKWKTPDSGRIGAGVESIIRTADGRAIRLVGGFVN
jgi:hypothetical protein